MRKVASIGLPLAVCPIDYMSRMCWDSIDVVEKPLTFGCRALCMLLSGADFRMEQCAGVALLLADRCECVDDTKRNGKNWRGWVVAWIDSFPNVSRAPFSHFQCRLDFVDSRGKLAYATSTHMELKESDAGNCMFF